MEVDNFASFVGKSLQSLEKMDHSWFFTFGESLNINTEGLWRLVGAERIIVTSEDHQQQFGLPSPLDAIECVTSQLKKLQVQSVACEANTGDLLLTFAENLCLQFLPTSSVYEAWRVNTEQGGAFCDGSDISFFGY